jgi:hypothetical protein
LWLALLLLALPFGGGGHPSLTSLVIIVPASVSLTGRAISALMGDPGASGLFWTLLGFGTVVELAFVIDTEGMDRKGGVVDHRQPAPSSARR